MTGSDFIRSSQFYRLQENIAEVSKGPMIEEELEWMRRIGDYVYGKRRTYE